jgi:anti-sigma regulatory factor (Ser/Thr protein kinase)
VSGGRSQRVLPSAKRLMASLRNLAYDMPTAIADLVDNSISAKATEVRITFGFEGENSWVRIADNGVGMTPDEIKEALRYGTNREYDELELGKFGLGLKTASLSQCRRHTVVSRSVGTVRPDLRGSTPTNRQRAALPCD